MNFIYGIIKLKLPLDKVKVGETMKLYDGFTPQTNESFKNSKTFLNLTALRKVLAVFALLFAVFGFTDIVYFPDNWTFLWSMRFGIVIPLMGLIIVLSFKENFIKYHQILMTSAFIVGGVVISIMLILQPDNIVYYGGLLMVFFSGYLLVKLRYGYATIGGWTVLLFHVIGVFVYHGSFPETFLYGGLFMIGANLIGMAGAYNIEKSNRDQFLRENEIEEVNETLNKQNIAIKEHMIQLETFIQENKELNFKYNEKDKLTTELKVAKERFEAIARQSRTFFYELDKDGLYTYVSNSVKYLLGYTPEELVNKKYFYELFPKVSRDRYKQIGFNGMKKGTTVQEFVNPLESKDNRVIWVSSFLSPVYGPNKEVIAYRGSDKDVTREKEAKDSLKLFKSINDQSNYGSAIATTEGIIIYANNAFCEMHGFTKKELINKPIKTVHTDAQMKHVKTLFNQLQKDGSFLSQEVWHKRKNNDVFPTIMTGKKIETDTGPTYFSITMFDITKEKAIEVNLLETKKELEASKNHLQLVMDNLPIGIAVNSVSPKVNFSYINDDFLKIYDVSREDLEKEDNFWKAVYEDKSFREHIKERVEKDTKSGNPDKMKWQDIPIKRKGQKTRYITAQNTKIPEADLFISTVIDVTDQKTKEEEIRHVSNHDYLTNIPNRRYFQDQLVKFDQSTYYPLGIAIMDLNGLKLINDAFGHSAGNRALKAVAKLLLKTKGPNDFIARIGGDEFAMICPNTDDDKMANYISIITQSISEKTIENIALSMAIGYSIKTAEKNKLRTVLSKAENNMYKNKVLSSHSLKNDAISSILETLQDKFNEEKVHSERVSRFCKQIGQALNLREDEVKELEFAGLYHDIGKISIPDAILDKPGKLTPNEWKTMKNHTLNGYQILRAADRYSNLAEYAMSHHERIDGNGYPNGIKGDDIPLFSRIISVADAYEAMTSDRPYRKAIKKSEAIEELRKHAGTQFDAAIVDLFINKVLTKEK